MTPSTIYRTEGDTRIQQKVSNSEPCNDFRTSPTFTLLVLHGSDSSYHKADKVLIHPPPSPTELFIVRPTATYVRYLQQCTLCPRLRGLAYTACSDPESKRHRYHSCLGKLLQTKDILEYYFQNSNTHIVYQVVFFR